MSAISFHALGGHRPHRALDVDHIPCSTSDFDRTRDCEREELKRQLEEMQRLEEERWQASAQLDGSEGFDEGFSDFPFP